jgi:hypothetical protein
MSAPNDRVGPPRPAAAAVETDAESGDPGDNRRRALFALEAMLKRGLIGRADYEARRGAIEAGQGKAGQGKE